MKTVLVCGSRDWDDSGLDSGLMWSTLGYIRMFEDIEIIHGGARGADMHAGKWAHEYGVKTTIFEAQWNKHGKAAGPIRNQRMLDEGKPDLVVGFINDRNRKSVGARHMLSIAKKAGVKCMTIILE